MLYMEKRFHRRISGHSGLFHTSDFRQLSNLKRLFANGEHGRGRIPTDKRSSRGDTQQWHIYEDKEISEDHKAEKRSIAEDMQMPDILGYEGSDTPGAVFHLEECDLEVSTSDNCSACPSPGLAGRSSEGFHSTFSIDTDNHGVEFRKNGYFTACGNTKSMGENNAPNQSDAGTYHDGNFLRDLCYHVEETTATTDEVLHPSDDLLDSLKVLSSDKELLQQFVWGPQTNLMEHAHKLKNTRRSNLLKAAHAKFFEKRNAHKNSTKHKGSDIKKPKGTFTRIVTLRPIPSRMENPSASRSSVPPPQSSQSTNSHVRSRRESSGLSFQELKSKFKHAIGEVKDIKSKSNARVVHAHVRVSGKDGKKHFSVPNSSSGENKNGVENQHKKNLERKDEDIDLDRGIKKDLEERTVPNLKRETNFQREAKTHLAVTSHHKLHWKHRQEMQISKELWWNILYLEGYDFPPLHDPSRLKKSHLSPRQMRNFPSTDANGQRNSEKVDLARHASRRLDCSSKEDVISHPPSGLISCGELPKIGSKDEGEMKAVDSDDGCNNMSLFENTSTVGKMDGICRTNEDEETQSPRSDPSMEAKLNAPSSPPTNLQIHGKEFPGVMMEKLEHSSPASVLIPSFADVATSYSSTVPEEWGDGLPLPPRNTLLYEYKEEFCITPYQEREGKEHVDMEEFNLGYVGSLLDASGLVDIETWRRKQPSDNLLDPSLYDEVETPFGEIPCDLKLLFDCISEALEEIRKKYFPENAWASLGKNSAHPFPCRESLAQQVCGNLTSHSATLLQESLNQVIEKELNTDLWSETCVEIDDIGFEFEDEMLDELLEEVIVDISQSTS